MHIPSEFFITTIKELSDENIEIAGKTIDKTKSLQKNLKGLTPI